MASKFLVSQAISEQVEAFQNGQTGADERHELLIEDQELLEIDGPLPASAAYFQAGTKVFGTDRIDQVTLLREPFPRLALRRCVSDLLVHLTPRVGVP
jgi:hypothetical protein